MTALLASIPSPHKGTVSIGPLTLHMYGVMLLLAILACLLLTAWRWRRLGGDTDLVLRVAVWGVAFGVLGARLYHDATSWDQVPHTWWGPFAVWKGGLGVWGGILFGSLAGAVVVKRSGQSVRLFMDAIAPGLLLAQAIGRWGNWWNQELYGKPTNLPWKLEIDAAHQTSISAQYRPITPGTGYYQPTFLYEFLYDLAGVGLMLFIGSRFRIRPPGLFALYVSFYTLGRFFEELLRIDPSHEFLGLRLNAWVSLVLFIASTSFFVWWQFIRPPAGDEPRRARPVPQGPTMAIPKGRVRS